MERKILAWIDSDLTLFGVIKSIQIQKPSSFFAIYDVTNNPKQFCQTQKIIKFEKSWFLYDNLDYAKKDIDFEYLKNFEEKYHINIWTLINNDRYLNNHNEFYKFSDELMLSIIEQQIKLYEKILEESNPNYVIMSNPPLTANYLFLLICRKKKIKTLVLTPSRLLNRYFIDDGNLIETMDEKKDYLESIDFNSYHKKYNKTIETKNFLKMFQSSKINLLKSFFNFISSDNSNIKSHYTYFGRTKIKVIKNILINSLKSKIRKKFVDTNLIRDLNLDQKYIYFPLHMEPERTLLIDAPFHTNQLDSIRNIVKSIPADYKLLIKEHPSMKHREWRPISFYKEILSFPNVLLIHPSFSSDELIKNSSLVIAITGSASFDSIFYEKPSITLTKTDFSYLEYVTVCESWEKLPILIRESLTKSVKKNMLLPYIKFNEINCFSFEMYPFVQEHENFLHYGGYLVNTKIDELKFNEFIKSKKSQYDFLSEKFIEKMN